MLIASTNQGKIREFREMLGADRFTWSDLSAHPDAPHVEETGRTFRDNACIKAAAYAKAFNTWTVADDSGLEVDALDGKPGVYSARWAQMNAAGAGDQANNALLIQQLTGVPDDRRTARFVCVLALADPRGSIVLTVRDTVEGRIIHEPRGSNGFGYDPLFLVHELGRTTAELTGNRKHQISHRGKALRRLRELMERTPIDRPAPTEATSPI